MKWIVEKELRDFPFWGGAKEHVVDIWDGDWNNVEANLQEFYAGKIPSATDINDMFWFEMDMISTWLGYEDYEELLNARTKCREEA